MFLKIGHRGARAYEVENTLESFGKAIELGANAIELDVRESRDGVLAVIHDESLKRVFGTDVMVKETTMGELKALTGNRIPALEDALRFIDGQVAKILLEIKEPGCEAAVLAAVERAGVHDRCIVISFHEESLAEIRRLDPSIETGLIFTRHKGPVAAAVRLHAQYLLPLYRFIHRRNIEDAHRKNLKVIVWTVNTEGEAMACREKGVDGIASDRPDILGSL